MRCREKRSCKAGLVSGVELSPELGNLLKDYVMAVFESIIVSHLCHTFSCQCDCVTMTDGESTTKLIGKRSNSYGDVGIDFSKVLRRGVIRRDGDQTTCGRKMITSSNLAAA